MTFPQIPGYTADPPKQSLAQLMSEPMSGVPEQLWFREERGAVMKSPSGWLTVEEVKSDPNSKATSTWSCVLVSPNFVLPEPDAMYNSYAEEVGWIEKTRQNKVRLGYKKKLEGVNLTFFVQARTPHPGRPPVIDISHPFLWYWGAFDVEGGWEYLDGAGRNQELIRIDRSIDGWSVKVRASEFRHFLHYCSKSALLAFGFQRSASAKMFDRYEDSLKEDWITCRRGAMHHAMTGSQSAFSWLDGTVLVHGQEGDRVPQHEAWARKKSLDYPLFKYGVDEVTGKVLTHTCKPNELGTYFHSEPGQPHYLTPVYFDPKVLRRYTAEPSRYTISSSQLSCLNLWSVAISRNSKGLVEVYLGDIGRDIPADEWPYWLAHNVLPDGEMDEGRFRRDFLGQWASSDDPIADLRHMHRKANEASKVAMGEPLWRELDGSLRAEFESLVGPLDDDPSSIGQPLLVLTRVLVDSMDPKPLKSHVLNVESGDKTLQLLRKYLDQIDADRSPVNFLQGLQALRSQGGFAHYSGSRQRVPFEKLGIADMGNIEAFTNLALQAASALATLEEAFLAAAV